MFLNICRLEFWNLKQEAARNALSTKEINMMWLPYIVFTNTEFNDITESDEKTELVVIRKTTPE